MVGRGVAAESESRFRFLHDPFQFAAGILPLCLARLDDLAETLEFDRLVQDLGGPVAFGSFVIGLPVLLGGREGIPDPVAEKHGAGESLPVTGTRLFDRVADRARHV